MANQVELVKARTEEGKNYWLVIRTETDMQTEKVLFASPSFKNAFIYCKINCYRSDREAGPTFARAAGA